MASPEHGYIFFSIHERLFDGVASELVQTGGARSFSGFCWGLDQLDFLESTETPYRSIDVFTRDFLPKVDPAKVDWAYLAGREAEYGCSLHRMIYAERHMLGTDYDRVMALAEQLFRHFERRFETERPAFVFSEHVSGLTSYICWTVAKGMGIPFYSMGSSKLENRMVVCRSSLQVWEDTNQRFAEIMAGDWRPGAEERARAFVEAFRDRPKRLSHMYTRARLPLVDKVDVHHMKLAVQRYFRDPGNPTLTAPSQMVRQRARRLARERLGRRYFEAPVPGEKYVLYPIHFQPEATTLVQAPMYLDQAALIADIAKSLPAGYRLYVKEHFSNRGRRSPAFYESVSSNPPVRLLRHDTDSWALLRDASAIAVITGSMGWEGLLLGKPVISFGEIFYNACPLVHRGGHHPKDEWSALFRRAILEHGHDERTMLAFVAAVQETTYPGFLKNGLTFPKALAPENVKNLARALAAVLGTGPDPRAPEPSTTMDAASTRATE